MLKRRMDTTGLHPTPLFLKTVYLTFYCVVKGQLGSYNVETTSISRGFFVFIANLVYRTSRGGTAHV